MKDIIDKKKLLENQRVTTVFNTVFAALATVDYNFTADEIKKMMLDSDIKSAIDQRKRGVNQRLINIKSEKETYKAVLMDQFKEINLSDICDTLIDSKFRGYSIQEIIYNDDLTMKKLKQKPADWFIQQWNSSTEEYEWVLTYGANVYGGNYNEGESLPFAKYLIPIYKPDDVFVNGRSELEPIYKYFKIKENALTYANQIVEKYGGIITWFIYNPDTTASELNEMVEGIQNITDGSIMPIPEKPGGQAQGLNHEFGFINLANLSNELHMNLLRFCKEQISQYLIGSTITMTAGESGSYSSGEVANDLLDSVIASDVAYVEYWLEQLVYFQSIIFGFNEKDYHISLEEKPDPKETQEINKAKIENYKGIKDLGYQVSVDYIASETGIPVDKLSEVEAQPQVLQFQKKKSLDDVKKIDRDIDEELQKVISKQSSKVTAKMADAYIKAYSKIKTKSDIDNVKVAYKDVDLAEQLLLFELFGIYSQTYTEDIEFEEEFTISELFNLPFEEAIKYYTFKIPRLFSEIDEKIEIAAQKTFWIKKATDIEVTQKTKAMLEKSLELGGTFREFKDDIGYYFDKAGIGKEGYYLENVFRTNVQTAYGAGRLEQQQETKEQYPYWLYNAIEDDRTSDICNNLADRVYRADNPIWNTIYPPSHYGCRSVVTPLDDEQIRELELGLSNIDADVNKSIEGITKQGFNSMPNNQLDKLKAISENKESEV